MVVNCWLLLLALVVLYGSSHVDSQNVLRSKDLNSLLKLIKKLQAAQPRNMEYGAPPYKMPESRPGKFLGYGVPPVMPRYPNVPVRYGPPYYVPPRVVSQYGAPPTSPRNPFLPIIYGRPYSHYGVPPTNPSMEFGAPPTNPSMEFGAPPRSPPMLFGPPPQKPSESLEPPPARSAHQHPDMSVKQHLLEAIHHIVDAVGSAPEEILRQMTAGHSVDDVSKIDAIQALLNNLPADRLRSLRDNPDFGAIMKRLGVSLPGERDGVAIAVQDKPDHVDEDRPKVVEVPQEIVQPVKEVSGQGKGPSDIEVVITPNGVEIVPPKQDATASGQNAGSSNLEVVVKPDGIEIVVPEKQDAKATEETQQGGETLPNQIKPEPIPEIPEMPVNPGQIENSKEPQATTVAATNVEEPVKPETPPYEIPKGIEQLPLTVVPDNQHEAPAAVQTELPKSVESAAPASPPEPLLVEFTTALSETVETEVTASYTPSPDDVPILPTDVKPWISDSFRKKLLQAVTKALREYQQKLGLTTRAPSTEPPPKAKDEKLQELLQDTRSKIASMLKIIDQAAEDGKIPGNLADEIDLNTPGILVQLTELEQMLGKDTNESVAAAKAAGAPAKVDVPLKPDGTPDWGKILTGRNPPTAPRETAKPEAGKLEEAKPAEGTAKE